MAKRKTLDVCLSCTLDTGKTRHHPGETVTLPESDALRLVNAGLASQHPCFPTPHAHVSDKDADDSSSAATLSDEADKTETLNEDEPDAEALSDDGCAFSADSATDEACEPYEQPGGEADNG